MQFKAYLKLHPPGQVLAVGDPRLAVGVFHKDDWPRIVEWANREGLQWDTNDDLTQADDLFRGGPWNSIFYHGEHGTLS